MRLGSDGFWLVDNYDEMQEAYNANVILSNRISDSYRKAIGVECESTAALAWDSLVSRYMQQVEVSRADAENCVATNLASFVTGNYPVEISQRVMRLYPLCRTTSFGKLVPMPPAENVDVSVEPDRVQLEKIMDCEDKDWDYFARTDPTPTARDFVSGVKFSPLPIFVSIDSISVVDCETGEEMLKPPSDADIAAWSKPSTPYVVELRSDDNEPLTVEWLNEVRPIRSSSLLEQGWPIGDSSFCYFDIHRGYGTDKLFLWICVGDGTSVKTIEVQTRGEVRAICRALKAEVPR